MRLKAIWLLGLVMVGLASPDELGDTRFFLSLATPNRTAAPNSVVLLLVENAKRIPIPSISLCRIPRSAH